MLYPFYVLCGVAIMYSLMISLAATSIWLGRNQTLYNFWFYITNFSRYPMEIYAGTYGEPAAVVLHLHHSRADRRECPGAVDGVAAGTARRSRLVVAVVRPGGDGCEFAGVAVGVHASAGELPQRQ